MDDREIGDKLRWRPVCRGLVLAGLGFGFTSCANERPTVAINHWWNLDFAKNSCRNMKSSQDPCVGDPTIEVTDFEARLVTAFASEPGCAKVVLIGPSGKASLKPFWSLMIDFVPGKPAQDWTIVHTIDQHKQWTRIRKGEGKPDTIARAVCAAVNGTGASVQEE